MSGDRASTSKGRSYQEIGDYWDSHDLSEVWDATEPVEFEVDLKSRATRAALDILFGGEGADH